MLPGSRAYLRASEPPPSAVAAAAARAAVTACGGHEKGERKGIKGINGSSAPREGLGRAPGPRRGAPRTWVVGNAPRRAASGCTRPGEHGARGVTHRRRTAPSSGPRSSPLSWDRSWTTGCCNCQSRCSYRRRRRRSYCLEGDFGGGGRGEEGYGGVLGEDGGVGGKLRASLGLRVGDGWGGVSRGEPAAMGRAEGSHSLTAAV